MTPTQICRRRRLLSARPDRRVLRLAVLSRGWTPAERKQLYVIVVLFLGAALFWSEFEQAGSTLNLFADRNTRNVAPRLGLPEQLVPVAELAVHHHARAAVRVAVGLAGAARQGAVEPGEVRRRTGARRRRVRRARRRRRARRARRHGEPDVAGRRLFPPHLRRAGLSPVGLSAMSKLAPVRIGGLIMGVWFLAAAVGNYIGGRLAGVLRGDDAAQPVRRRRRRSASAPACCSCSSRVRCGGWTEPAR